MTAREEAERALAGTGVSLRAVAWAVLDLADAIREGNEPQHMQMYPEENE